MMICVAWWRHDMETHYWPLWKPPIWQECPDSKAYGANMRPTWGRQDPGEPYVGPMNLALWVQTNTSHVGQISNLVIPYVHLITTKARDKLSNAQLGYILFPDKIWNRRNITGPWYLGRCRTPCYPEWLAHRHLFPLVWDYCFADSERPWNLVKQGHFRSVLRRTF